MAKGARDRVLTDVARWAATLCLAVVVAAAGGTATRASASTTSTSSRAPNRTAKARVGTQTRYAAPVDLEGRSSGSVVSATVQGTCTAGSDVIANVSVYRCFAGHDVYDPCWAVVAPGAASAAAVLCLPAPWSKSAVKVVAPHLSAGISISPGEQGEPWGVRLTDHQECLAVQGARNQFRGTFVDFTCSAGPTTAPSLELLRGLDRHKPTWTYRSVERKGTTLSPGPVVDVQTAWYAGPSLAKVNDCRGSNVAVSVGARDTAPGHAGLTLLFRNTGSTACRFLGYPDVAGLDLRGRQVVQAKRTARGYLGGLPFGTRTPPVVVLAPGQTASAMVESTDVSRGAATGCAAYPALLVTPPNTSTATRVPQPLPSCSPLYIHPIVVGESGTSS
ncbi:MAG: DUF4232 domain-containing protein [Acidimicrobiaceae bacterium]|nr:DUF4232 domain-containing protein [Acidimicrobiaceae bacterium]